MVSNLFIPLLPTGFAAGSKGNIRIKKTFDLITPTFTYLCSRK
jgi:hypothetical protein